MNRFKKIMASALAVISVTLSVCIIANADEMGSDFISITENDFQPIPYYEEGSQLLKGTDSSNNPDLTAMAEKLGYSNDTFNFVNFSYGDYLSYDEYIDFINSFYTKCSSEEETHSKLISFATGSAGVCYGISAIAVLVHNGYIDPSSIQSGAENLNDISINTEIAKIILKYALSQNRHEVELANYKNKSLRTDESYIDELLEYGEKSNETCNYFLIAYTGIRDDDSMIGHSVTGIGMADGNWTYNDINYDKCILTYDSNCKNTETGKAGGFTDALCIYVNSKTKQFCIPGYGFSTENGSGINFITDSANRLNYGGLINGTDDIGEDISDSVKMYLFGNQKNGLEVTAIPDNGEEYNVNDKIESQFATMWGNRFYLFNANKYHIEQNKGVEYSIEHNGNSSYSTGIDGSTWGQYYTTRYSASDNYNYTIDIEPQKVSVTNKKAAPGYEDKEMQLLCSLSFPDKYYYYFSGTAAENETVSIEEYEDGVLLTSSDSTLKGNMLISSTNKNIILNDPASQIEVSMNIAGNAYLKVEDTETVGVYLDPDKDGVYDTPLETGDVNGDGKITIDDATEVLKYYAENAAGLSAGQVGLNITYPLSLNTADINGDKKIDISDATLILEMYAKNAAGLN